MNKGMESNRDHNSVSLKIRGHKKLNLWVKDRSRDNALRRSFSHER
jgi:hypothetical protein